MYIKKTKIVCTLGPSSDSVKEITKLVNAGMNVARLNFSHGTYESYEKLIKNIHKVEKITGKTIGIMQDLQGPKIRIGKMPKDGIKLENNQEFILTPQNITGSKKGKKITIPTKYKNIIKDVKNGSTILIDDGLIEAKITKKEKSRLICRVKNGGLVKSGQGLNLPNSIISQKTITPKDKTDLTFGLAHNADFIALSFIKSKKDIEDLQKLIKKQNKNTAIIAKIEKHEAVNNLKSIIKEADGVMVARGDLGADIPPEQVPIVQKRIIALANKYGKPVITATQVLYSMVKNARATRAEISDAANAVFDHTDAIMLSNETAVGKFPAKAVQTLTNVASTVEKELQKHEELLELLSLRKQLSSINVICKNACELAAESNLSFIVAYTEDGYTAKQIAKFRPYTPIITITNNQKTARELTLVWGLNKILTTKIPKRTPNKLEKLIEFIKNKKIVKKGQKIVVVCNASNKENILTTCKL